MSHVMRKNAFCVCENKGAGRTPRKRGFVMTRLKYIYFPESSAAAPSAAAARRPMTKEEWEKQQSVIRHVYDPESGRTRYQLTSL